MNRMLSLTCLSLFLAVFGCDSSATDTTASDVGGAGSAGEGGSAGMAGAAGSAGMAGAAGSAGESGAAGDAGMAGSAGSAGDGGMAGSAGSAGEGGASGDGGMAGSAGSAGEGGSAGDGGMAGAGGQESQCDAPIDCLDEVWPVRCMGRWACVDNVCEPDVCGIEGGCGDGVCEPINGESPGSCSVDCPDNIEPDCRTDVECLPHQRCDPCAASSCPACDDCVARCVEHGCPTEREPVCNALRPQCADGSVAVVQDGCWVCVAYGECGMEAPEPPQDCVPAGGRRAVVPNAVPCCPDLVAIGCDPPSAVTGGQCEQECVGVAFCTACGDGVCDEPENDCNCPQDCDR